MKGSQLMREATKTASVFGNKDNVNVSFEGSRACTDGSSIKLPMVDAEREFTAVERNVARGYLDHEAGHIKHSNMAVVAECKSQEEQTCLNWLEDARMERMVSEEYIGAAENLAVLNDVLGEEAIKTMDGVPVERLGRSAFYAAIFNEHHRRVGIGAAGCEKYLAALPEEVVAEAKTYVDDLIACENTRDVHQIVKRILGIEEEEEEKKEETPEEEGEGEPPEETEEGEGESSEGEGEGEGESSEGEQSEEQGHGEEQGKAGGEQGKGQGEQSKEGAENSEGEKGEPKGQGQGESQGSHEPIDGKQSSEGKVELGRDGSKAMNEMLGQTAGVQPKWRRYRDDWDFEFSVKTSTQDAVKAQGTWRSYVATNAERLDTLKTGNAARYKRDHQKIRGTIGKIKREMENKLLAKRDLRWEGGQKAGRFDVRRCVSAYNGSEDVFETKSEDRTLDTAVTLMIDHSGSMHRRKKMDLSRLATICLGEVLAKVGVPFRVVGFDSSGPSPSSERHMGTGSHESYMELLNQFTDISPVFHMVYKGFDDSFARSKAQIGAMSNDTVGSHNCDPASIYKEWEVMKRRDEEKKMIIVLSDGSPETCWSHDSAIASRPIMTAATKAAIKHVVDEGGTISGIGIGSPAVQNLYDDCVVIREFEDLPKVSLKMLERGIFGGDK